MIQSNGFWYTLLIVVMALAIIFLLGFNLYVLNGMEDIWGMFMDLYSNILTSHDV
jgi:hypothetical protein